MEAEEVIVVAELQGLRGATLLGGIVSGGTGQDRIAPADQNLHLVVVRHMVRGIVDVRYFLEGEGGWPAALRLRPPAAEGSNSGSSRQAEQHAAPRQATLDQLTDRDLGGARDALVFVNHGSSFFPRRMMAQ